MNVNPHKDNSMNQPTADSSEIITKTINLLINTDSVIDIGCGGGEWLASFQKNGTKNIVGIDGPWVLELKNLSVKKSDIEIADLSSERNLNEIKNNHSGKYNLAVSLEVGEHLPRIISEKYIETLTSLAPVVLFSAAVPYQGGLNHINEQWPDYWRDIFKKNNFECADVIRPIIWDNKKILPHYKQNIFIYYSSKSRLINPIILESKNDNCFSKIHPDNWELLHSYFKPNIEISGRQALKIIIKALVNRLMK